jgi:hypothetical protein
MSNISPSSKLTLLLLRTYKKTFVVVAVNFHLLSHGFSLAAINPKNETLFSPKFGHFHKPNPKKKKQKHS